MSEQRIWLTRIITILLAAFFLSAFISLLTRANTSKYQAQAESTRQDPRYAPVLQEIQAQHLSVKNIQQAVGPLTSPAFGRTFFGMFLVVMASVGTYSLIYLFISPFFLAKPPGSQEGSSPK